MNNELLDNVQADIEQAIHWLSTGEKHLRESAVKVLTAALRRIDAEKQGALSE